MRVFCFYNGVTFLWIHTIVNLYFLISIDKESNISFILCFFIINTPTSPIFPVYYKVDNYDHTMRYPENHTVTSPPLILIFFHHQIHTVTCFQGFELRIFIWFVKDLGCVYVLVIDLSLWITWTDLVLFVHFCRLKKQN